MKKLTALSLIFIMLLSFCGCNSTKLSAKNLVGTWETELSLEDFAAMTDEDIDELADDDMPKELYKKIKDLKFKLTVVYYDNNTSDTKVKKIDFEKFLSDEIDIMLEYYRTVGLLKSYQEEGYEITTNEELDTLLKEAGTSIDELMSKMEKEINESLDSHSLVKEWGMPDKKGYYTLNEKPEKFTLNEESIIFINDDDEEEITYCKLTDKDTLKVNKIYCDYEEYKVDITFKRVK